MKENKNWLTEYIHSGKYFNKHELWLIFFKYCKFRQDASFDLKDFVFHVIDELHGGVWLIYIMHVDFEEIKSEIIYYLNSNKNIISSKIMETGHDYGARMSAVEILKKIR